jgi:hypothetical protein
LTGAFVLEPVVNAFGAKVLTKGSTYVVQTRKAAGIREVDQDAVNSRIDASGDGRENK